jgi:transcriptional regulator with XRE-family HTH domain
MEYGMQIGRTLKAIRTFHRMSLSETGERLGYAKSFIFALENDKKHPSMETLQRYAESFDIPVSSILLLAEAKDQDLKSLRAQARRAVTRQLLRILEIMSAPERQEK